MHVVLLISVRLDFMLFNVILKLGLFPYSCSSKACVIATCLDHFTRSSLYVCLMGRAEMVVLALVPSR